MRDLDDNRLTFEAFDSDGYFLYDPNPLATNQSTTMTDQKQRESKALMGGLWHWAAERLGIQGWGQILILGLLAAGGLAFNWGLGVDKRLDNIEASIRLMPLEISSDLLSHAKVAISLRKLDRALQATEAATALVAEATVKRLPAKREYFQNTTGALDILDSASTNPDLSEKVAEARVVLANYRSSLELVPALSEDQKPLENYAVTTHAGTIDKSTFSNTTVFTGTPNTEFFNPPVVRPLDLHVWIRGLTFVNGMQTLDGLRWDNVTFINTLIKYDGGAVQLLNKVRFINCTFQIAPGRRGAQLANYVTLDLSSLFVELPS